MEAITNRVAGGHRSQLLRSVSEDAGFFLRAAEADSCIVWSDNLVPFTRRYAQVCTSGELSK